MITTAQLNQELLRLSKVLDERQAELVRLSQTWAEAERDYRLSRRKAYHVLQGSKFPVAEKQAEVDAETAPMRYERDLADSLRQSALEAVRNGRQQISALQSIANAVKEEMRLAGDAA